MNNISAASRPGDAELKLNVFVQPLRLFYRRARARAWLASFIARLEGGELRSATLRRVLQEWHDVEVGAHSYGSLLTPGMADRFTSIGRYVSIGPNVRRFGAAHPVDGLTMHPYWYNPALGMVNNERDVDRTPIVIESESWIGANVTILPGCRRIGIGAVVGAGSVVTKDVADFAIVVGNPARQIGIRLSEMLRSRLLAERPWEYAPARAARMRSEILLTLGRES
ncbi:CatB-related O-acetyltransferase [Streptomyces sp. ISL-90]|nr:CatB-related O-acetyltransferase [Streptomyces sp. ISL-90]